MSRVSAHLERARVCARKARKHEARALALAFGSDAGDDDRDWAPPNGRAYKRHAADVEASWDDDALLGKRADGVHRAELERKAEEARRKEEARKNIIDETRGRRTLIAAALKRIRHEWYGMQPGRDDDRIVQNLHLQVTILNDILRCTSDLAALDAPDEADAGELEHWQTYDLRSLADLRDDAKFALQTAIVRSQPQAPSATRGRPVVRDRPRVTTPAPRRPLHRRDHPV